MTRKKVQEEAMTAKPVEVRSGWYRPRPAHRTLHYYGPERTPCGLWRTGTMVPQAPEDLDRDRCRTCAEGAAEAAREATADAPQGAPTEALPPPAEDEAR